jgi:hypothetical protein
MSFFSPPVAFNSVGKYDHVVGVTFSVYGDASETVGINHVAVSHQNREFVFELPNMNLLLHKTVVTFNIPASL